MVQRVLVLIAGFMLLAGPAWGESVAEFYKGKTLRIVVGLGPGGATDTNCPAHFSRFVAAHPRTSPDHRAEQARGRQHAGGQHRLQQ